MADEEQLRIFRQGVSGRTLRVVKLKGQDAIADGALSVSPRTILALL